MEGENFPIWKRCERDKVQENIGGIFEMTFGLWRVTKKSPGEHSHGGGGLWAVRLKMLVGAIFAKSLLGFGSAQKVLESYLFLVVRMKIGMMNI